MTATAVDMFSRSQANTLLQTDLGPLLAHVHVDSEVFWTAQRPVPLPDDVVERFKGRCANCSNTAAHNVARKERDKIDVCHACATSSGAESCRNAGRSPSRASRSTLSAPTRRRARTSRFRATSGTVSATGCCSFALHHPLVTITARTRRSAVRRADHHYCATIRGEHAKMAFVGAQTHLHGVTRRAIEVHPPEWEPRSQVQIILYGKLSHL